MVSLKYSAPSLQDLQGIKDFIAGDSPLYARRFIQKIRVKISILKKYPEMGKPIYPERYKNLRQLLFNAYRIIYQYSGNKVIIIPVHHQSRLLENIPPLKNYKE